MKKVLLCIWCCMLCFVFAKAQSVNEHVNFDFYLNASDNDLVNNFSGGLGLTQIQSNGITGGCLQTPDSINWGNDNAIYCSKYKPGQGDTIATSICFKFDSTHVSPSNFHRALSVWLNPYADWNHYIVATVSGNKKMEIITYGWINSPSPNLTLYHNHWYRYDLRVIMSGGPLNQVSVKGEVFELGPTGLAVPASVNSSSGTFNDSILVADTSIQVSVSGALYGGATYLDDFNFHGIKGISNCIHVGAGIPVALPVTGIAVFPSFTKDVIYVEKSAADHGLMEIEIADLSGKCLIKSKTGTSKYVMDVSFLTNGIYLVSARTAYQVNKTKILVSR